ncbi:hypothetical protein PCYB_113160 [Plasmodium cynomolgi strain B]|uniref:CRAL-TRIO domain-containing protein n=1 Tax=Plasmodium cynomolgi (strain B) TaxID=1120755 RepID=K6UXQ4_PLACD|nr:hypothetical protein PCYB_113160 [Plasmodium cynomolgi strain B]GAB67295.1 hypothetical protein PCYB_113160 [Plasmodium cynomolgi strain B]
MDLSRGKVIIEKDINKYTIDENVFFFEPKKEDVYDENTNLRYIFHNTFISTDEEIAISEFKKYCKNKSLKINKSFFENECLRYLYSAQFDFAKALDLIKSNYEFRLSNILPIKEKDVINYINKGVIYWHGRDKKCRPILIINLLNVESLDIENYISLIDCSGISLSKFPMSTFMKLLEIMNSKYRCRLFRMYIIDAPKIFKTFGKSFLNFAPSYMTKKLKILDTNYASYLREEIFDTQLEKRYGGVREIRDSVFYPFAFYPNCSCEGGAVGSVGAVGSIGAAAAAGAATLEVEVDSGSAGEKDPPRGHGFQQMSDKARDFLMSGYSLHLKLVDRTHKELMRKHYSSLASGDGHGKSRVKRSSSNNSSMKHLVSHGNNSSTKSCFIDAVINQVYQIESNNILKNNKFVNAKGSYVVSVGSTHNWLFKLKHLFLPDITINYLKSRFPFIINYLIVKSNFKSMQEYAKYIETHACVEGDDSIHGKHGSGRHDRDGRGTSSGHPYGGKLFHSLSSTANTTSNAPANRTANAPANRTANTIAHFGDDPDEKHSHKLNSVKSMNSHVDITRVKEGKSRGNTPHAHKSRRSKKKGEGGTTQNGFSKFDAHRGGSGCGVGSPCGDRGGQGDDSTRRTGKHNKLPSKDAKKNFYANSESIFEDNNGDKSAKDKSDHLQNKQPSKSRREWKEKTQKCYKIKATNNLFRDELVNHTHKVECVEKTFLNRVVGVGDYSPCYDFFVDMDNSGKATESTQRECANSAVSLTNATCAATSTKTANSTKAANSIKTMSSMNTLNTFNSMNSANSENKLHRKSSVISMKSVIPKRLDYANSKFQRQSTTMNTSISTKQSKYSFSKLGTGEHLEQAPRNDPSGDATRRSNANSVKKKISSPSANVTHTADDGPPTEEKNPNLTAPETESDCTKQTKGNASDRSKRRLNKIKIIGLQFFNKRTSKM